MKPLRRSLARRWQDMPLFWKIYLITLLFTASIVTVGEIGEELLANLLYGLEDLSESEEFFVWTVVTILPTVLGSYLLARQLADPLRRLTCAASQLSDGDLTARGATQDAVRGDEIGELTRTFNYMATHFEHEFNNERRLLADISHELRSPLTRMSLAVALLRRQASSRQAVYLDRLEMESERMNALIAHLLDYARRELETMRPSAFDLCDIVRDVARDASFEGMDEGKTLHLSLPDSARMFGDPALLRQALDNVIRNALRYTPPGASVDVTLSVQDSATPPQLCVRVRDHGSGVPESALRDMFRPFYRVEAARNRDRGGVGLGLALAEQAVRLHHGRIRARNAHEGGLEVIIRLPLVPGDEEADSAAPATSGRA
ncbi:MAG TPA: HAMP domain-containing protein [Candidatus Avidesulfovibrio excrementigallinarum]|nr:HAMP domain-containing protein [Candidatus Avidesulfovibrio excrementigallinarum]